MLFSNLLANIFPFFSVKSTMSLQGVSINKTQIPLTLAFAIIEYKIQKATFKMAILDRQCGNSTTGRSYRVFCSTYI